MSNTARVLRVNHDCYNYLEVLPSAVVKRLGLDSLRGGLDWAVMTLPNPGGTAEEWNIYVHYSRMSIFPDNTLCMPHELIKMAEINKPGDGSRPSIRLNGQALELITRGDHHLSPETLLLQLPMRDGYSSAPALGRTSFLPPGHSMLYASMNRANGFRMLNNAGMTRGGMDAFLDHHEDDSPECPTWLLGDLLGVTHYSHIPFVTPFDGRDDTWSSDEDEPAPPPYDANKLYVSSLYHHAPLPQLWATFAGSGEVPDMHVPILLHGENTSRSEPRTPGPWWVRTEGFI